MWHIWLAKENHVSHLSLEELLHILFEHYANNLLSPMIEVLTWMAQVFKEPINAQILRIYIQPQGYKVDYSLHP